MLIRYRRPLFGALATVLLALAVRTAVPLFPLIWQGSRADARVVERETLSQRSYRYVLEFVADGHRQPVRVSRVFTGSRRSRWLTVGAPVRIVYRQEDPSQLLILSYPGTDWLAPVVLSAFGLFFAFAWRQTARRASITGEELRRRRGGATSGRVPG